MDATPDSTTPETEPATEPEQQQAVITISFRTIDTATPNVHIGAVSPFQLLLAATLLTRIANLMMDAEDMRRAQMAAKLLVPDKQGPIRFPRV